MAKAIDVAKQLILLGAIEDEPEYLTHLRLQKLLYHVQAWSLVNNGRPLFEGRIEAWAHGPVVCDLYPTFADYGDRPIPPDDFLGDEIVLEEEDRDFIATVWESFKVYSATSLRAMTRSESPWIDSRKGFAPPDRCTNEITHEAMTAYFSSVAAS